MRDDIRRELEALAKRYVVRDFCPDSVPQAAIDAYAASHKKMAITTCQWCGCDCRQFPWLLDQPSTCQVCKVLNP
jgi:hypothetical protein